ncbi:MAG: phenylalanine--tRNA ligase subunit beta [Patescibacteria group bacterium]
MKFSYNWLQELTGWRGTPEKLADFLTRGVFEVESIAKVGRDWALDTKILPNRVADASGHAGLVREILALSTKGKALKARGRIKSGQLREHTKKKAASVLTVRIENADDCPRYTARVLEGVKIGPSPEWLRERLETCGLQSINNVVDAANYAMLETGQPMHIFDYEALKTGKESARASKKGAEKKSIIVRRARAGEKLAALDGQTYALSPDILVIADDMEPLAIAGIKGGQYSGVHDGTTMLILESANFDPVIIHRASRSLRLRTDASYRFEHGLDRNQTVEAADALASLIGRVAGGTVLSGVVDVYPVKARPRTILFRPEQASAVIGAALPEVFYKKALTGIGCAVKEAAKGWMVTPPTVRRDLGIEEDLIEEAARLYGYENIAAVRPVLNIAAPQPNDALAYEETARDIFVSAGFTEHEAYEFTGEKELTDFGLDIKDAVALENPTSPETAYLLTRPVIKYVLAARDNLKNFDTVRLFGFAKSFTLGNERTHIALAVALNGGDGKDAFYQAKGAVDHLLEALGISDHWYDDAVADAGRGADAIFHPQRVADIKIGDTRIGRIGEIHPAVGERIKARERIAAAEVFYDVLWPLVEREAEFRPVGKCPAIVRDLALVVPERTRMADVVNAMEGAGGPLLIDTDLFDEFQDETMRATDEKSFAFHCAFQSPERTLTDGEIDRLMVAITAACEENGWTIR